VLVQAPEPVPPKFQAATLSLEELRASIEQAGLELVETTKLIDPDSEVMSVKPRVVRQRKTVVKVDEEPLQMVETIRKD